MIAIDSSSFIGFLNNDNGKDVPLVADILRNHQIIFPPLVISELLSNPGLPIQSAKIIKQLPILSITGGYWERTGEIRAILLRKKLKARLADTLIAQICIDHNVPLLTRDKDFKHFAKYSTLILV